MKKRKKLTQKQLETRLWELCRKVADILYAQPDGAYKCYTCGKPVEGRNKQLGHFIPRSTCGAYLKYDMRNLRWQCLVENLYNGGSGAEYYRIMVGEKGQDHVDQIFKDKNNIVKAYDHYVYLIGEYKKIISEYE